MSSDRFPPPPDDGRVVRFRPRGGAPQGGHTPWSRWPWPARDRRPGDPLIDDLSKYEQAEFEDNYRHRMTMNVLALVVTVMLVVAGVWLANKIVEIRKNQDCYLSGRRNCTPIETPPVQRG